MANEDEKVGSVQSVISKLSSESSGAVSPEKTDKAKAKAASSPKTLLRPLAAETVSETESEKVSSSTGEPLGIVVDFHGTTTPRSLVMLVLIPYIKKNLDSFLKENWTDKKVQKIIKRIRKEQSKKPHEFPVKIKDKHAPDDEMRASIVNYIGWIIEKKKNQKGANRLMKRVWQDAYEKGLLKTPIYEDVPVALKAWKENGIKIYGFSNNSIEAQKEFYKSTDRGNLTEYYDDFFDSTAGKKDSPTSYMNISAKTTIACEQLFLITDLVKEAKAAKNAGLRTTLIYRPGNKQVNDRHKKDYGFVRSFKEIKF